MLGIFSEAAVCVSPWVALRLSRAVLTQVALLCAGQEHGHGPRGGPGRPGGEHPGGREVRHTVSSLGPQPRLV